MSRDPYAFGPDGLPRYIVTRSEWGRDSRRLVSAPSLDEAKRRYGWTRERHVYLRVRRARESEVGMFDNEGWPLPPSASEVS